MENKCEHPTGTTKIIYHKMFFKLIKIRIPLFVCNSCNEVMTIQEMLEDDEYDMAVMTFHDD